MSVETKLQLRSLMRDASQPLAAAGQGLTKAENVVLVAPGVAESRPNFDLFYQYVAGTDRRIRALREFVGHDLGAVLYAIDFDLSAEVWAMRALNDDTPVTCEVPLQSFRPPFYDESETRFAEARETLYLTAARGEVRYSPGFVEFEAQKAGVDVVLFTDWKAPTLLTPGTEFSWAYRFVYVRRDTDTEYERRSPPSPARVCWGGVDPALAGTWGQGTRFYFPTTGQTRIAAGDSVEFYRTLVVEGFSPSPEFFLAQTHVVQASEVAAGYFVPTNDVTLENQLGAALYTNPSQGGERAAKYAPPVARDIAFWRNVMWHGNTYGKERASFTLRHLYRAGIMRGATLADYTIATDVVTVPDSSLYEVGQYWTDNYEKGPTVAGAIVPALTTILALPTPTTIQISALAIASGTNVRSGTMSPSAPQGIIAEVTGSGTYVATSPIVTGLPSTAGWRAGMYWTDAVGGPTVAGTRVPADTRILSVDSSTQITMTRNALTTGAANGVVGDIVSVTRGSTVRFYAWPSGTSPDADLTPWTGTPPAQCFQIYTAWNASNDAIQKAVANLALAIDWYAFLNPLTFPFRAVPLGMWSTYVDTIATRVDTLPEYALGLALEEWGVGIGRATIASTDAVANAAFSPGFPIPTSNDRTPGRLCYSDIAEPEAVPLLNYFDVGAGDKRVLALIPTENALLVFKEDGLFSVTGVGPHSWSVDVIDANLVLVRPECAAGVGDAAYAWTQRGFFRCSQAGVESVSAGLIDVELRAAARYVEDPNNETHGCFVLPWLQRNLVLFGVPGEADAEHTAKVYALSLVTGMLSEWPLEWGSVCASEIDAVYYSRPPDSTPVFDVEYEVRKAVALPRGYDRDYTLAVGFPDAVLVGDVLTLDSGETDKWLPVVGDMVSVLVDGFRYYRRLTEVELAGTTYTLTLEEDVTAGTRSAWHAYETRQARVVLQWPLTAPAGIPVGSLCREIHMQLDLTSAPSDASKQVSIPEYIVGGRSERDIDPYTVTSNRTRTLTVQPLRVGCSRQIARSAYVSAYFAMTDIFALRINGCSLIWEGTSERTRR